MSLENDIQQREFRNESQKAILNILFTSYFIQDKMNELFKEYDITRQQYNVLRILRGQHPGHASVNLIRERMLDKMSDASRIVERLRALVRSARFGHRRHHLPGAARRTVRSRA